MRVLLFIVLISLFAGCGTRKTEKSSTELNLVKKDTAAVAAAVKETDNAGGQTAKHTEENNAFVSGSGTATPINPDKPMKLTDANGKTTTVENGTYSWKTTAGTTNKTESYTTSDTTAHTKAVDFNANFGSNAKLQDKAARAGTEREGVAVNLKFWIGGAIAAGIIIYILWFLFWKRKKANE